MKKVKNKKIKIILKEAVRKLGIAGEIVEVKPGYFFNYLLPNNMAIVYNEDKHKNLQETIKNSLLQMKEKIQKTQDKLGKNPILNIETSTNTLGILYGEISKTAVLEQLKKKYKIDCEKKNIIMYGKMKTVGNHKVSLFMHGSDFAITVKIVARGI